MIFYENKHCPLLLAYEYLIVLLQCVHNQLTVGMARAFGKCVNSCVKFFLVSTEDYTYTQ